MHQRCCVTATIAIGTLVAGSAFAQPPPMPPPEPPPSSPAPTPGPAPAPTGQPESAPRPAAGGEDVADKKLGLGADLLFLFPTGELGDRAGPQIGPVLRAGYRIIPKLELTARVGYLYGVGKESAALVSCPTASPCTTPSVGMSVIPISVGARYFFVEAYSGIYAAAELGTRSRGVPNLVA